MIKSLYAFLLLYVGLSSKFLYTKFNLLRFGLFDEVLEYIEFISNMSTFWLIKLLKHFTFSKLKISLKLVIIKSRIIIQFKN